MTMDPETARKVAEVLADYDDVVATWTEANEEADRTGEAPDVRTCEQYSDGLERVAHDLVAVLRPRCERISGRRGPHRCMAPATEQVGGRGYCSTHARYVRQHPDD